MKKLLVCLLILTAFQAYSQYPVKVKKYIVTSEFSFHDLDKTILYLDTTFAMGKQVLQSWDNVPMNERPKIILLDETKFDKILYRKTKQTRNKNSVYFLAKNM